MTISGSIFWIHQHLHRLEIPKKNNLLSPAAPVGDQAGDLLCHFRTQVSILAGLAVQSSGRNPRARAVIDSCEAIDVSDLAVKMQIPSNFIMIP